MRAALAVILGGMALTTSVGAPAQEVGKGFDWQDYRRQIANLQDIRARAMRVRPKRRDEPLREQNITDDEVREIQWVVRDYLPRAIVNIGPVVTGCPCEEGALCMEQVWLQANTAQGSVGLLLSRTQNRWDVSAVQKWWLRREELGRQVNIGRIGWREYVEREWALVQDFPVCTEPPGSADNVSAQSSAEPRK